MGLFDSVSGFLGGGGGSGGGAFGNIPLIGGLFSGPGQPTATTQQQQNVSPFGNLFTGLLGGGGGSSAGLLGGLFGGGGEGSGGFGGIINPLFDIAGSALGGDFGGVGQGLGGIFGDILGPLVSAGGSGPFVQQTPTLTELQRGNLDLANLALMGQIGRPGQQAPGASDIQQQLFSAGPDILNQLINRQPFDPNQVMADFAPVQDFAERTFQQSIIPSITGGAAASGVANSSSMNAALANAGGNLSSNIFAQIAPFMAQAREGDQNRQLQSLQQGTSFGLGAGGAQRDINQQVSQSQDPFRNPALNLLPLALGQPGFENIVFPGQPSFFDQFAPVAAAFGSGALNAK